MLSKSYFRTLSYIDMPMKRPFFVKLLSIFALCLFLFGNFTPSALALGGTQLPLNEPAPQFTLPTNTGDGKISLSDYQGKWVVLYFYPQDFTSGCTIEARRFQQDLGKYEGKNTQIVGISVDDVDSHREFCDAEGLKFPLLADVDGSVSKAYGSWLGLMSLRHTYLIDPNGILRKVFLGVRPNTHSEEVLATLDELQNA
jgi:thioredoxin-dependent peroxiredoxin